MLEGPHFADFKRSSGPFAEDWRASDIAGGFIAILVPFVLSYAVFEKRKILKLAASVGVFFCLMGIFATYSRGAMLGAAVSVVFVALFGFKEVFRKSKRYAGTLLLVVLVAFLAWQRWVPESIVNRVQGTVVEKSYDFFGAAPSVILDESSEGRKDIWSMGLEIFRSNPVFGVGFLIPQFRMGVDTHNAFIQIAAEMGIIAFLIFLWFLWRIWREARLALRSEFIVMGLGFIGCLGAFLVVNNFYSNFFRDTVVGSFWVVLGLLASSKALSFKVLEDVEDPNKKGAVRAKR